MADHQQNQEDLDRAYAAKQPFATKEQLESLAQRYPTPLPSV